MQCTAKTHDLEPVRRLLLRLKAMFWRPNLGTIEHDTEERASSAHLERLG